MDSLLLFIQNSLHCKQGGLYETSFLYVLQLLPTCYHTNRNIISNPLLRLLPTCYHTNRNIISNPLLRLLPTCYHRNRNIISILYSSCYPPAIIQTRTSFLILYSSCYPPVTQKQGKIVPGYIAKDTRVSRIYIQHSFSLVAMRGIYM